MGMTGFKMASKMLMRMELPANSNDHTDVLVKSLVFPLGGVKPSNKQKNKNKKRFKSCNYLLKKSLNNASLDRLMLYVFLKGETCVASNAEQLKFQLAS